VPSVAAGPALATRCGPGTGGLALSGQVRTPKATNSKHLPAEYPDLDARTSADPIGKDPDRCSWTGRPVHCQRAPCGMSAQSPCGLYVYEYSDRAAAFCPTAGLLESRRREPSVITVPAPSLSVTSERPPGAAGEAERLPFLLAAAGTDGQRAYVCSWLPSVHPARRSSRCSPGMPSPGRAQRPGRRLNRGSVSGRRCDKGRLHRCRAQQSARGPRVAGRRRRCHQQVQSDHLRLV
jgi:hypothetical protein